MTQIAIKTFSEIDLKNFLEMSQSEYGESASTNSEHIRWKHLNSPFGASSYVSLVENNQVVGHLLIQPRTLNTASKVFNAASVMDLLIDKKYRSTPLNFIKITKACDNVGSFELIYHTANETTSLLYSKLFRFPTPFSLKAYGFPIQASGLLTSIIGHRVKAIDLLIAPLHWFLKSIAHIVTSVAKLDISQRAMTDDELETLCIKCLCQSGPHLARTNAFLKWRFGDAPLWPATVYRIDKKGQFLGYLVTRRVELGGINHLVLMDFILDPDIPPIVQVALRLWLIRKAITSKVDMLFTMVNSLNNVANKFIGFPLVRIPDRLLPHATPIFVRTLNNNGKKLEAIRFTHFTLADLDYF